MNTKTELEIKISTPDYVARIMKAKRQNPGSYSRSRLWFTSGCFDLFHVGHLKFLKEIGDKAIKDNACLVVAVNSDESILALKNRRSIMGLVERQILVAQIPTVSFVLSFDETHPKSLIDLLQPEVIVHGSNTNRPAFVNSPELEHYTGTVLKISIDDYPSTSTLIERARTCHEPTSHQ